MVNNPGVLPEEEQIHTWYLGHHWPGHCGSHASADQMRMVWERLSARGTNAAVMTLKQKVIS